MVGTYVETPLCWAISTGAGREDVSSVEDLKGKKIGVSRIGRCVFIQTLLSYCIMLLPTGELVVLINDNVAVDPT